VREGRFRTRYNAAVIAVARNGQRIHRKIGDIELRAGDTLLLEAHPAFADQQRNSRDFYLVSRIEGSAPPRHERAWISLVLLAALVIVVTAGWLSMLKAAMLAAGLMIITRCCTASAARRSVDWSVLLVIAAAFGIGAALDETGAARAIAQTLLGLAGDGPVAALAVIYLVTMLATAFMTNNAAAVLMFPIAIAAARQMEVDILPFTITVMMAASAEFATPIGYQTNLMVYGAGGYRFGDYLRIGLPLNILVGIVALLVIPRVWPM
jgi:di/tricarboxylate transporter